MFKKIMNLFKTKQEIEMDVSELVQWLKDKNSNSRVSLEPVCKEMLSDIKEYLGEFKQNCDDLAKAEIKDKDKIEQRIVTVVLGNRESFVNQSDFFLKRINPPNYEDVDQSIEFSINLKTELDNFAKITQKSFYTSQHLFYKEVENLKKTISKISKLSNNFDKRVTISKIGQIKDFENNINMFKNSIDTKDSMLKDLEQLKTSLEQIKNNKEKNLERIEQMKVSPNYKDYQECQKKLDKLLLEIKKHKLKLDHNFAVIDYALKKYTKIADEEFKLINAYQTDAFDALLQDKDLEILEVLQKITKKVLDNELVLKDSKKQKILAEVNIINRDYLGKLIEEYEILDKNKNKIQEEVDNNKITQEIQECEEEITNCDKEIEFIEKNINNVNKNINKIDYSEMIGVIEKEFDAVFDINLKLKNDT